jgi:hypothetical protein
VVAVRAPRGVGRVGETTRRPARARGRGSVRLDKPATLSTGLRVAAAGNLRAGDGAAGDPQDDRGQEQQPENRAGTRGRSRGRRDGAGRGSANISATASRGTHGSRPEWGNSCALIEGDDEIPPIESVVRRRPASQPDSGQPRFCGRPAWAPSLPQRVQQLRRAHDQRHVSLTPLHSVCARPGPAVVVRASSELATAFARPGCRRMRSITALSSVMAISRRRPQSLDPDRDGPEQNRRAGRRGTARRAAL